MAANYDKIARIYDLLSRIVYGKNIVRAQVCLLKYVPPKSNILIIGGGTGWILEELAKQHPSGLVIDYVENSAGMIALSRKRSCGNNEVNYINLPIEHFTPARLYHVILTPFLFDNFIQEQAEMLFAGLDLMLKDKGFWLYADFVHNENEGRLWQRSLLKLMYLFFRITCGIETSHLASMEGCYVNHYQKVFEQSFYFKFIKAVAYQKK